MEKARCRCEEWTDIDPCPREANQEDLLCDVCRNGCSRISGFKPKESSPWGQVAEDSVSHMEFTIEWVGQVT